MISQPVFLDANVYFSKILLTVFLDMAERNLFALFWSDEVLNEVKKNWKIKYPTTNANGIIAGIKHTFFAGEISKADYSYEESNLVKTDIKDRHVLAAAYESGARYLVTANISDFDTSEAARFGVMLITPDDYLCFLYKTNSGEVINSIKHSRTRMNRPQLTENEFVDKLIKANANLFAKDLSNHFGSL